MTPNFWPEGWERLSFCVPRCHEDPAAGEWEMVCAVRGMESVAPPVVFLAGGPGESPIDMLAHPPFRQLFDEAATHFPVVLLDQRGCGRSGPNWRLSPLAGGAPLLSRAGAEESLKAQCEEFLSRTEQFQPTHVTPVQSALDIRLLGSALGVEKLRIWAHSYGTHLAMACMKSSPDLIDRAALCGFEGPNQTWKFPAKADAFLKAAGLAELFLEAQAALQKSPPTTSDGIAIGDFGLRWMAASWIGISSQVRKMESRLRGALPGASELDRAELEKAARNFLKLQGKNVVFYLNDLASSASPDRLAEIERQCQESLFGSDLNFPFPWIRELWQQPELPNAYRIETQFQNPVLVITGGKDAFTPTSNLKEQGSGLTNLTHFEIPEAAHDELLLHPQMKEAVFSFFK